MSSEKQIEEMAELMCDEYDNGVCRTDGCICNYNCEYHNEAAKKLYEAGYRKQSEGEWVDIDICAEDMYCSVCGGIAPVDCEKEEFYKSNFCPNCGAKMKGGTE